jgi:phosphoribosylanthranilate isomerase
VESILRATRVKICGLTRIADVGAAVDAGADALGFVFAAGSKRVLSPETAGALCRAVPAFVSRVGLFQDQDAAHVEQVLRRVPLSLLQFHGREDASFCRQFGLPYIKAVAMSSPEDLAVAESAFDDAAGLVLDSHQPGRPGGTGATFDWKLIGECRLPLILAGGLNPGNVARAVRQVRPWAVDVSSGVESAAGIKDANAMRDFIREARREH